MDPRALSLELDETLTNATWIRDLARELVRDGDRADDLAQDAALIALQTRGPVHTSVRAWMRTVMRNLVHEGVRRDARRRRREERAAETATDAGADAAAPAVDVVERLAVHREVQDVLLDLKPIYREAIYLRYFEDLPPSRIAKRLELPVSTVKTRLDRALKQMRVTLDHRHGGDRAAWMGPLVTSLGLGGRGRDVWGVAALLLAVSLSVGIAWFGSAWLGSDWLGAVGSVEPVAAGREPGLQPITNLVLSEEPGARRNPFFILPTSVGAPPELGVSTREPEVRGRVIGVSGARRAAVEIKFVPVSGVPSDAICGDPGSLRDLTDFEGGFALPRVEDRGVVLSATPELRTLFAGRVKHGTMPTSPVVVVAPQRAYRGRVVDEAGKPMPFARVAVELPYELRSDLGLVPDATWELPMAVEADEHGRFVIERGAFVEGARLRAEVTGYRTGRAPLRRDGPEAVDIVVRSPAAGPNPVQGVVLDHLGHGVGGAWISDGALVVRADDRGRFAIRRSKGSALPRPLLAVHPGAQAARFSPGAATEWPERVVLRLGPAPLAVRGRVVDANGQPVREAYVWVMDPTLFAQAEGDGAVVRETRVEGLIPRQGPEIVENLCLGHRGRVWRPARSDAKGRFSIDGLQARAYRVAAMRPGGVALAVRDGVLPAEGGAETVVVLPRAATLGALRGRVGFANGLPAPDVSVGLQWEILRLQCPSGRTVGVRWNRRRTRTDAHGRFVLSGVPAAGAELLFDEGGILPKHVPLRGQPEGEVVVDVLRRAHVQVVVETMRGAETQFVDERGATVVCFVTRRGQRIQCRRVGLTAGRTPVVAVPATVERVQVVDGGRLVGSERVSLLPGPVSVIRL